MTAIWNLSMQTPAIKYIVSRNIEDTSWLKNSAQEYKKDILKNLWINKNNSWIFSNIKKYLINAFNG